ncbi:MMPL family transporter [Nocardioides mangrovi]|uniref:MMPL family transporter n=1 Tax=Nocardioides mangrovi TaxID=2874580 RepID=A0ABS7UD06_9ACTN|nr:MMPL family transporter [Nocardioides mangrovi]MBZ5738710.1 MMPL family transporter [Nocardioides mangrovi]
MSRFLHRLGSAAAAHPWRTISAWVLVVIAAFGLAGASGGTTHDNYDVPGARSQTGIEQLRDHLPAAGGTSAQVVVHDPHGDPLPQAALTATAERLAALDHVGTVSEPRLSSDADTALYYLTYDVPVTDPDMVKEKSVDPLEDAVQPLRDEGLQVELGGELPNSVITSLKGTGELAGVIAALALLVLTFGSVVAAGLPLAVALIGLAVGSAGVTLLAATMDVSTAAPTIATMVGLGVGIDYALLLVTRHVEFLRGGLDKREAAGRAMATAGRSVVFAAATVLISLLGLRLAGLPVYSSFGYATAIAVIAVLASALTLVPALCGLAGRRMLSRKVRLGRTPERTRPPFAARWAAGVARRPVAAALAAVIFLLALAAPTLAMRTWPQDGRSNPSDSTLRRSYDLVESEYGAGANGTFTIVVDNARADARSVAAQVAGEPGIVGVTDPVATPDGALSVFDAQPAVGPTDEGIDDLVAQLRSDLPAGVEVTGTTAFFSDITGMLSARLWIVVGFVVGVSVLLLAMMFRSVVVPIKAAVMNLLSIAASYGILVAVFQWGWGTSLLGIDHSVPVSSWVPILNFAILFGLSMDYEVFLLSRIREDWLRTGDARGSVERGLAATGRVISAAAAIMVVVFLGFATEADLTVKMLGFGMATAILLDATVVRMVLVPATMTLLGRWNWWLPAWLDRLLPSIAAEEHATDEEIWDELDSAGSGEKVGA